MKLLLSALLLAASTLHAQTWKTVVPEGGTATLPATPAIPITYKYGGLATATTAAKWCDQVTVTTSTPLTAANGSIPCTVNGVKTADPDPNVVKEIDVLEGPTQVIIPTVVNGKSVNVTVPAVTPPVVTPPPPPPPAPVPVPPVATTPTAVLTFPAIVTQYSDGSATCVQTAGSVATVPK